MGTKRRWPSGVGLAVVLGLVVWGRPAPGAEPHPARGVCYARLDGLSEEGLRRLQEAPEVSYVLCQESVGSVSDLAARRAGALAARGKRLVLQLWYGPGGRYNWSYHSYPALALDPAAQQDFYAGVDRTIDRLGARNLYAVHLLEEDGWFGVNVDVPGDAQLDGQGLAPGNSWENGNCYDNYVYALAEGHEPWSVWTPSVRRFAEVFRKDTGLDMRLAAAPTLCDPQVLDRWMGRRLWAGAKVALARHLREKYPLLHSFVWGYGAWSAEPFQSDGAALRGSIDGLVQDPYGSPYFNYVALRVAQTHLVEPENVCLLWGTTDPVFKASRLASAYLAGAHGLGFYEDTNRPDVEQPDRFAVNLELFRKFAAWPHFQARRRAYYAFGNDANGPVTGFAELPVFQFPEVSTARECYDCEVERYDLIVLHQTGLSDHQAYWRKYHLPGPGLDETRVLAWVKAGGVLALLQTLPPCLPRSGLVERVGPARVLAEPAEMATPDPAVRDLGLRPSYRLYLPRLFRYRATGAEGGFELPAGVLLRYGKGAIYCEPDAPHGSAAAVALMPGYHAEVLRAALRLVGKGSLADELLIPAARLSTPYYHALSGDGKTEVWLQFDEPKDTGVVTKGEDVLTGGRDVPLDAKHPAVIVRR